MVGGGLGLDLDELEELTGIEGFDVEAMLQQAMQFIEQYNMDAST